MNMNDEDNSTIYDTVQKKGVYEVPLGLPEENEAPLYDNIREDLRSENEVYATELESHKYDSVSIYVADDENSLTSSQPEAGDYLLPDDIHLESQDLQQGEPPVSSEDWNSSMEKLHSPAQDQEELYLVAQDQEELYSLAQDQEELHSPAQEQEELHPPAQDQEELPSLTQDQEELPSPAQDPEPQEDGGVMEKDLSSPTFPIQQSRAFFPSKRSSTRYSAADGLEEDESTSTDPEISLFVKVRAVSDRHICLCRWRNCCLLILSVQGKMHDVMVLGPQDIFRGTAG